MKIPTSIRRASRPAPNRIAAPPQPPDPRRTKARPDGSRRALPRPRPARTLYGRMLLVDLARIDRSRSDLARALGTSAQRVWQVVQDPRMDADPGADRVMDGWRDRIRAALEEMSPAATVPVPRTENTTPDATVEGTRHAD